MRLGRWLVASLALVFVVPLVFAQRPGGGFGGGSLFLLTQKSVQDELKMSDEQVKKVTELQEKQRESLKGVAKEDRKAKFEEMAKESQKQVAEILKPEQNKRFKQISLQQRGSRAFADPEVAEALKITDEQKEKIKGIQEEIGKEMRDARGDREKMASLRKTANEKVEGVLTAEQKTKLKELMGEPFKGEIKFPERRPRNKTNS